MWNSVYEKGSVTVTMNIILPEDLFKLDFLFAFVLFNLVLFLAWNFTIDQSYAMTADLSGNGEVSLSYSLTNTVPEFSLKDL